jgi:hypothetical protein
MAGCYPLRSLTQRGVCRRARTAGRRRNYRIDSTLVSLGSSRGSLFRDRLLDLLLADGLQLLVLRRAKNFLHPRRGFAVDGPELLHFLHSGKRSIVLDRLDFWTLFLEDRQHLDLLLCREFELLR